MDSFLGESLKLPQNKTISLEEGALEALEGRKNLLAFSAGVDSTALYHLLKEEGIDFDIALVNYKTRIQSDEEMHYARKLADQDGKTAHILEYPLKGSDFESQARKVRYDFFGSLIGEYGYENLITAHQLDDLLEWGLMQLCKGCGVAEFAGMEPLQKRENYTLVRPLLFIPKAELEKYLKAKDIRYFVDESNLQTHHTRNLFRHEAAAFLMKSCPNGIARSFRYMIEDKKTLLPNPKIIFHNGDLVCFDRPESETTAIRQIDKLLKERGYLLSGAQKREISRQKSAVVGGKWVVVIEEKDIWICPYVQATMPKEFKERCRKAKIPKTVRPYLFKTDSLERLLSTPFFSS